MSILFDVCTTKIEHPLTSLMQCGRPTDEFVWKLATTFTLDTILGASDDTMYGAKIQLVRRSMRKRGLPEQYYHSSVD